MRQLEALRHRQMKCFEMSSWKCFCDMLQFWRLEKQWVDPIVDKAAVGSLYYFDWSFGWLHACGFIKPMKYQ